MTKIEWAPWDIPLRRRLQTLAAGMWISIVMFSLPVTVLVVSSILYFGNTFLKTLLIAYLIFMYFDKDTADNGGRGAGSKWVRSWLLWKYFLEYFPINLVKTADLPPDRNYLFAAFPHGILAAGIFGNLGTDYSKFHEFFPKIRPKLVTLKLNFFLPFFRELPLGWGGSSASEQNIRKLLTASNDPRDHENSDGYTSNAVCIVVGGAQEALYSRPGIYQLELKRRKGFIRLALSTGTPLVPVFSFGEVDIFDQPENPSGSLLRRFQEGFKKITGIAPAFALGRGYLQYSYGFIPRRSPITTVVGAPIEVRKIENPTKEEISELHDKFTKALVDLFETHKLDYIMNSENVHLIL